jgi:hypothetical protein
MFIGHFALGFAAKRAAPRVSLAVLFAAAQLADTLWPMFVALGVEQVRIDPGNTRFTPLDFISYPYSHSLVMLVVWGVLLALAYCVLARADWSVGALLAALVVSHWVLDWITHRPDMPVYPGGRKVGLGLWNSVAATVIVEVAIFAAGVAIYARATRPRDAIGRWSHAGLVTVLLLFYALNIISGPPPSVSAIWIAGVAGAALLFAWSGWSDRHRTASFSND